MCQCQPTAHLSMPGRPWYTFRTFDGAADDIERAAKEFEGYYGAMLDRRAKVAA